MHYQQLYQNRHFVLRLLYTKNTIGRWTTVTGKPETVISGYGAYGDAGRIGSWSDGLVVMRPGDVVKITLSGGYKFEPYALWLDGGAPKCATWKEYETLTAITSAQAEAAESGLKILFGLMPAYTWSCGRLEAGIEVVKGLAGQTVALGEMGTGRTLTEVPLVDLSVEGKLMGAAVAVLKEETKASRYGGEPETKVFYGLTSGAAKENGFLVKVSTNAVYTRGSRPEITTWKGGPRVLAEGRGAEGAAGRIYDWPEVLVVLHEGDVLYVRPAGGYKTRPYALFLKNGQLKTEPWVTWKIGDAKKDPQFYVAKGTAPSAGHVPAEWIGKIVSVSDLENSRDEGDHLEEREVGEVISVSPLVLNLGWDGQDRHDVEVSRATWVRLEADKKVRRLEGEAADKRTTLRAKLESLMAEAGKALAKSYIGLASEELQKGLYDASRGYYYTLDTLPTEGGNSLAEFARLATATLAEFAAVEAELGSREAAGKSGEILPDYRVGRRGSKNGRAVESVWAILPDGSTVTPIAGSDYSEARLGDLPATVLVVTHYESNYGYRYSEAWTVAHLPAEVTEAQRAKVAELEPTAHKYFVGGKTGWDLVETEVYFQTAYSRDFRDEAEAADREMTAVFPIDVGIWKVMRSRETGTRTVWAERRTEGDPNRPSGVMAAAFKAALAKRLDD